MNMPLPEPTMTTLATTPIPPARPWYREAMLWMIIAIPALTFFAGLYTVWTAQHQADAPVERVEPVASALPPR